MAESDWASIDEEWPPRGSAARAVMAEPFRRAFDRTPGRKPVVVVRCGDSRSTQPVAAARFIDNAMAAYFNTIYANTPGTPMFSGGNQTIAASGAPGLITSRNSGSALDATLLTHIPPGVLGIAWRSGDGGGSGETIQYSPSWKSCNPRQFFKGAKLTDRTTARMSIRHFLLNKDPDQANSGQLTWTLFRNDLVTPAFSGLGTQVGTGTTALALDGTTPTVYCRDEVSSNAAHVFSTSLAMTLTLIGSDATLFANWVGSRFENYANPQGVIVESYGSSGYKAGDWIVNFPNFTTFFAAHQPDCIILWFGANDAAQNVTAATFQTNILALVDKWRTVCPDKPIWLVADHYRGGLTGAQLTELDKFGGVLLTAAKSRYKCGFINLRKKTEAVGWGATTQVSVGAATAWADATGYVAADIVSTPSTGADFDYWRCLTNHTSAAATNKPGLEQTNSSLFWEPVLTWIAYEAGAMVHTSIRGSELVAQIFVDTLTAGAGSIARRGWRER